MIDIKVIPTYFRTLFNEDNIKPVPEHWRRPKGYNFRVGLSTSYSNFLAAAVENIAKYCGISARQIESPLIKENDPMELINKNNLLEVDHKVMKSEYGTSILFQEQDSAMAFIKKLNNFLDREYDEIEDQIKVKLLLSSQNIQEYEKHNVIFTSRYLAEHFISSFDAKYFFRTLEIVKIEKEGFLGIEAYVKFYTEVCGQCLLCGRPLEDEFSKKTGIGPVCAKKKLGIKRTSVEDVEIARKKILEVAEKVGTIGPIFIPKNQIKKIK